MKKTEKYKSPITGHLDIKAGRDEVDSDEVEILIHGDREGLRSLAHLLLKLADLDQEALENLPVGAREHYLLRPNWDIANSSEHVIVGRLDAKGTGKFYDRYIPKASGE